MERLARFAGHVTLVWSFGVLCDTYLLVTTATPITTREVMRATYHMMYLGVRPVLGDLLWIQLKLTTM